MHEELVADGEEIDGTWHDRIKVIRSTAGPNWPEIWLPRLQACVRAGDFDSIIRLLKLLVPAYCPSPALAPHLRDVQQPAGGQAA
jgi:hypothetical protein